MVGGEHCRMIESESKRYASEPTKVKLWEVKYYPIFRTPEVQQAKIGKANEGSCVIIDYGSCISRAVATV